MTSTYIIGIVIYLIGAMIAWFQIRYWNRDNILAFPADYIKLTLWSLLSWLVYPVYIVGWVYEQTNK